MANDQNQDDESDERAPLSDLAEEVSQRKEQGDLGTAEDLDEFTEMDVEELDFDEIWADLESSGGEPVAIAEPLEEGIDRDIRVISKSTCHGC
ncbi:MAG: hypothetical protein ABEI52_00195, partial [Halobacteriaceae archaeon]